MELYAKAGYDILAITDHWKYGEPYVYQGTAENGGYSLQVLSGCEYNLEWLNEKMGVYETFHIVGVDMKYDPQISREMEGTIYEQVQTVVKKIREAGGTAILAHPAWSLNTPEQMAAAGDVDALEIYNSVSECGMSDRPYSGLLVDMLAMQGIHYPLLATDDTHYYNGDECRGMIMLEADAVEELGLAGAIRGQKFYATQGPEIHLERISEDEVRLLCSPAVKIAFLSNVAWTSGRIIRGENLTEAVYTIKHDRLEKFVRAEVTDASGLTAWSNLIWIG